MNSPEVTEVQDRGPAAYIAEFVGTLLLVFFVGTIVVMNSAGGLGFTDWAVIGLLHFLLLTMLVYSVGHASGAGTPGCVAGAGGASAIPGVP